MAKNKHKLIKKEKGDLKQKVKQRQNKEQIGFEKQQNEIEDEEGIFSSGADPGKMEESFAPSNEANTKQILSVEYCLGYQGFFYKLMTNNYLKLVNSLADKIQLKMIVGLVEVNGKVCSLLSIKQNSTLIFAPVQGSNIYSNGDQQSSVVQKIVNKIMEVLNKSEEFANENIRKYLKLFDIKSEVLIWSSRPLTFHSLNQISKPWQNINTSKYLSNATISLVIGSKNTGKSMFCEYLYNIAETQVKDFCILDLDVGRNRTYPGSISLQAVSGDKKQKISLWVGEFSPVNSIPKYLKAISYLFQQYKDRFFTHALVINTMGYLIGVGQLIIYQIFNITKPKSVLFMSSANGSQQSALQSIRYNIQTGKYVERAHFYSKEDWTKTSTKIQKYLNEFAQLKPLSDRFQPLISIVPIRSIQDLICRIIGGKLQKLIKKIDVYESKTDGKIRQVYPNFQLNHVDMRIVVLGRMVGDGNVLISGIGFGWSNQIYYDKNLLNPMQIEIGITTEGIDFEKSFYQITETKLIELELKLGQRIPYLSPTMKIFGSKGLRNTPGKKIMPNKD